MEVKLGYKQTEVGVIPEEWHVFSLRNLIDYTKGFPFKSSEYQSAGIRIIRVSDTTYDSIKEENAVFVSEAKVSQFADWTLRENDLVVSTVGSKPPMYDSMVGKVILIARLHEGSLLNQNAVLLRAKKRRPEVQSILLNHLRTRRYLAHIESIFRGNANQASITLQDLFQFVIPLPRDESELRAIAAALSDADALIESLEQLVAKKRQIKHGAMQELLTGTRRLPGFNGKWDTQRFDELFTVLRNASNSRSELGEHGEVAYVHYGDIHTHSTAFLNPTTKQTYISRVKVRTLPRLKDGDILMADASEDTTAIGKAVEIVGLAGREAVAGLHTMLLRGDKERLADGYKGYLQFLPQMRVALVRLATGVSVYGITKSGVKAIEVTIPEPAEQNAIAAILSDMDTEIAALEAKLAKARQIKQGMMQELLTGRIRLV